MSDINTQVLAAVENTLVISKTDLKGRITYANDLFCTLTGYSREELMGKAHNIVRDPSIPKEVFAEMWETIKAGDIWTGIFPNRGKGGVLYVVDATVQGIKNDAGEIVEYISIRRVINDMMGENYTNYIEFSKKEFDKYYG
ncbi:MAG: Aerotaxis sensor receptor protein [uncultured Sulfurovum sp.]|uniref:Aerotaxis sensor receptor protein n=1 Tax=uncultured Sulfurovum sp. TaxID=269237 RepID=A0A6S6SAL9_9BACT|nr:MAG: Aerotaxis sensor receptor protein [uncultured Sulfurovum sp.]